VAGHLIDDGSERATRATPCCPKVNENWLLRLKDILLKICVVYFGYELTCHLLSSKNALRSLPFRLSNLHNNRCSEGSVVSELNDRCRKWPYNLLVVQELGRNAA